MASDEDGTQFTLAPQIASRYCLKGLSGIHQGKIFVLSENTKFGRTMVGRSKDCAIIIDDPGVSREHASIQLKDGIVVVTDQGSSNGTYVDGAQIQQVLISPGQTLAFEKQEFVLELIGPTQISEEDDASATAVMSAPALQTQTANQRSETSTWVAILIIALLIAAGAVALAWYFSSSQLNF